MQHGRIVLLNGAPRAGKSSIAAAIQDAFDGPWMNLGVDAFGAMTPSRYWPGIGLRPGAERPEIEALLPAFHGALYESIAAHSRLGLHVVADVCHHDGYTKPLGLLPDCARRLAGLPVLFVGVRCPITEIMARRRRGQAGREGQYVTGSPDEPAPAPVLAWEERVHAPGIYDLEVDTSVLTPEACASLIRARLDRGIAEPTAFQRLASGALAPGGGAPGRAGPQD